VFLLVTASCLAQKSERPADFRKYFSVSPTEHVVNELDKSLRVRCVKGVIRDPSGNPLDHALIEFRDRDAKGDLRRTFSDRKGTFRLKLFPGNYVFKITLNGYASLMGFAEVNIKVKRCEGTILLLGLGA
jgi:hypothetical protein